ncbi:hypothetical protein [Luteimonas saliphila]|uniref:hypothetical protein n=1 Tax=Luteimonas saliphila TaxID=2804919 RepID=UPI00192E0363|nr:hypothetical protein [Luteimonas saliphila]
MTPEEIAEKVRRFPAELKPNPAYEYTPPREVVINGIRCVELDGGFMELAKWGKDRK